MFFSLPAVGAILSLISFPTALQTGTALDEQRAEVIQEDPRAEASPVIEGANDSSSEIAVPVGELDAVIIEDIEAVGAPVEQSVDVLPEPEPQIEAAVEDVAPSPMFVTGDAQVSLLSDISDALSGVETAQGKFVQIAPDGFESTGDFYLRRPGRVRFEYDAPVPLLIVADGATVAVEDKDLETQDRVPLRSTPLGLLLDDDLDFESDADILSVRHANGYVAVALRDKSGETDGTLEIVLTDGAYDLVAWTTTDAAGGLTAVQLNDVETGIRISPRLFRIEEIDEDQGRD
ncbi:MAG: outer-membrane lipoprotein carrier protein LolA [Pseudomonadota bacterium]